MMDIQNFIGKSSTEADRVRAYRNQVQEKKEELLESEGPGNISDLEGDVTNVVTNVQQKNDISTPELEIELEREKEKPSEKSDSQPGDEFSISKKENGRYDYPKAFEKIYNLYPSQRGSKKAHWRKWAATRRKGIPQEDLELAAKNYSSECKKNGTEEQYIKQFKTFFGRDEHWREYIGPETDFDQEAEKQKRLEDMRKKQEEWVENYG
jgi:transcriptional regulator with AAA-type ATPase domain